MAEAGSFAERVKQQADIVRVVGEYVRLKKSGQNFSGLCPFHAEKTPSFSVSAIKQFYYCFGCGVGGDIFKFVQQMEKCEFPEAVRIVAEKCGIPIPAARPRSPEERQVNQQRIALVQIQAAAATFFARQLTETAEGKVARGYLEDRGLDAEAIARFGLGYAPSAGDALYRHLKQKYPDKLLEASGLVSRDPGGRCYDRFRRRVMFPIANEGGKVIAFGGRALGDEPPKYMNSPETPIYSKSNVLYHLDRAKEALRRNGFIVLVEGYMDAIAVARAGIANVVASCGTSLAEPQVKLLSRFANRIVVNYDPDAAGQAATERSLAVLLEKDFDIRVLALPGGADPDKFLREQGAESYVKLLAAAPDYLHYLIARAQHMDRSTAQGKLAALNFLMPHVQRVPNKLLRSEWATRIASELRVDEPVLREALRRAASERRGEVKVKAELGVPIVRDAQRQLMQMLVEADGFREPIAKAMREGGHHTGLETEKIFEGLIAMALRGERPDPVAFAEQLEERDRRLLFDALLENLPELDWSAAESCLNELARSGIERELAEMGRKIEAVKLTREGPGAADFRELLQKKQALSRKLSDLREGRPSR